MCVFGVHRVENLAFDGRGGLFVTDRVHATITKLTYNNATDTYIKTVWLSGFKHLLGVSVDLTAATPVFVSRLLSSLTQKLVSGSID